MSAHWVAWQVLTRSQLREQPLRVLATIVAIALGVALGSAVYLINTAALGEFDLATRRLIGSADLVVRGSPQGFDESLFVQLVRDPQVALASPVLELELTLPGDNAPLKVLGVDSFRASALQPQLMGELGGNATQLFAPDSIVLTRAAAQQLQLVRGAAFTALVGDAAKALRVIDVLSDSVYPEALGLMDIASAQWTLGRLGRLNRIDLRLRAGVDVSAFEQQLQARLPYGVIVSTPGIERGRAVTATRAYRVNLNMLALVALLTGAFLVFSTQSLAVLRRRASLGLLRALGVTRAELRRALLGEGAAIGLAGSIPGALLGAVIAALVLRYLGSGLGNRQLVAVGAVLAIQPFAILAFVLLGTAAACLGAWLPAREAAARAPALAMKAGDAEPALAAVATTWPGVALILTGGAIAWLPPIGGIPVPGYLAIALLLLGSILLIPTLMHAFTRRVPRTGAVVIDTALAQLQGSASISTVSVACIIVSFSLMVAMAIMVHSFRTSFDLWLVKLLPADLVLRVSLGSDTGLLSFQQQQRIAHLPAVAKAQFRRVQPVWLRADEAPVSLIARDFGDSTVAESLPLLSEASGELLAARSSNSSPAPLAWISQSLMDKYGTRPGDTLQLPLAGQRHAFTVAGMWRDYARPDGAIVITRDAWIAATGDRSATEAAIWRRPEADEATLTASIRRALGTGDAIELIASAQLRDRSLMLFDRAFAITYALEIIAVAIGLAGVGLAASSTALARRAQFGMLRHVGMLRRQVLAMLASEGVIMSALSAAYGLLLGLGLSLILVYVINRQSFNWSIDLRVPWTQLAVLSLALIAASALTAVWSGRAAMGQDAVRAVREDW
jgi:putative ABC transport system permease protein